MSFSWTTIHARVSASGAVARSCARRMCANSPDVHKRGSSRQSSVDGTVSRDMADRESGVVLSSYLVYSKQPIFGLTQEWF